MKKIWIDIDNTPHVLFFNPLIKELKRKNYNVIITARNYGGIIELLDYYLIDYIVIGSDYGGNLIKKSFGVLYRIVKLYLLLRKEHISVSISHGSRSHLGAAFLLRIPSITSYDYEFSSKLFVHKLATKVIVPKLFPDSYFIENKISLKKIQRYSGFKEQIYLEELLNKNSYNIPKEIEENRDKIIVLIRPPASGSHYFNKKSGELFISLLNYLIKFSGLLVLISPRNEIQKKNLNENYGNITNFVILQKNYDGISLILNSDVIISGGGTMNREAALLGVPVYSIFGGKFGYMDNYLLKINRLHRINNENDFLTIKLEKRGNDIKPLYSTKIKEEILRIIEMELIND